MTSSFVRVYASRTYRLAKGFLTESIGFLWNTRTSEETLREHFPLHSTLSETPLTDSAQSNPANAEAIETQPDLWLDRFGDDLFRDAMVRLGDRSLAADAVQEALLAAIQGVRENRYDSRSSFRSWLRTIVRNKAIDQIRRRSRDKQFDTTDSEGIGETLLFKLAGIPTTQPDNWSFDVETAFEREEFWGAFEGCMTHLSDVQRSVFTMKVIDALPTEEVCNILNISATNMGVLLHRARQALKACLEGKWFIQD